MPPLHFSRALLFSSCSAIRSEKRINMTFLFRSDWGKTPSQVLKILQQVFGDSTMSRPCYFKGAQGIQRDLWGGEI